MVSHNISSPVTGYDKATLTPLDYSAERTRSPLEKLIEFQGLMIRYCQVGEILQSGSWAHLEVMAQQSTQDVTDLLRARRKTPLQGLNESSGLLELGPRDDEMGGLGRVQDILHDLFHKDYFHHAVLNYRNTYSLEPGDSLEDFLAKERAYAWEEADKKCSAVCPSFEELRARIDSKKEYQRYLQRQEKRRREDTLVVNEDC